MTRVLFADDEVDKDEKLKEAVSGLRRVGFDVVEAATRGEALDLAYREQFDIAIIDLGWHEAVDIDEAREKESTGWDICDALDREDQKREGHPTLQIIFSRQFGFNPQISAKAARDHRFPLYKDILYADRKSSAGSEALIATVTFMEGMLRRPEEVLHGAVIDNWKEAHAQLRMWSRLTMGLLALGVGILLAGIAGALFWSVQVGTLTGVSGVVTSGISSLLLKQVNDAKRASMDRLGDIRELAM